MIVIDTTKQVVSSRPNLYSIIEDFSILAWNKNCDFAAALHNAIWLPCYGLNCKIECNRLYLDTKTIYIPNSKTTNVSKRLLFLY